MRLGEEYKLLIIKQYEYWTLVLNELQLPYVGRCYAWWRDHGQNGEGMRPYETPPHAWFELRKIFRDVERACTALGYATEPYSKEFLLNMSYLANLPGHNHHMHVHFVPRSARPLAIEEINLRTSDKYWGKNYYQPKSLPRLSPGKMEHIRRKMADAIASPA